MQNVATFGARVRGWSPNRPLAAWIKAQRKRLGWKSEELGLRLRAGGYEVQDTTIRTWEAGRRPSAANIAALERLFDATAPLEATETAADLAALVAALDRQTDAITALLARFDSLASEEIRRGVADALAEAGEPQGTGESLPAPLREQFA